MPPSDDQPRYPIRTVAQRTGLSTHVLRAWERRYGAVEPARAGSGGRLYSDADVLRFRLLRKLTAAGHPISQVARLPTAELAALLPLAEEDAPPSPSPALPPPAAFVAAALEGLEAMDGARVHGALTRAAVALAAEEFVDEVVLPVLRQVGELWETGRICPAHEHLLSAQVGRVLGWIAEAVPPTREAPNAVATTPAGQRHEFGALLAALVAAQEGWRVTYLGPDLPGEDIAVAVRARRARALLLGAALEDDPRSLLAEIGAVRNGAGAEVRILVGGGGAAPVRRQIEEAGAEWVPDFGALRSLLREIHPGGEAA